jgi:integral membrane sensor domain MASE1
MRSGADPIPLKKWFAEMRLAAAIGIAYLAAAWLGLAFLAKSENIVAVYWPAAGFAAGVLIILGPSWRLSVAAGVIAATIAAHLIAHRHVWEAPAFGVCNAAEVLIVAWLIERWFGRGFKLGDLPHVMGLFVAAAIGAGLAAAGATATLELLGQPTAPAVTIWLLWFAADALGIVTVAPVLIGLPPASHRAWPSLELAEGSIALVALTVAGTLVFALPPGPWATVVPAASLFPFVLWVAGRCQPVFAAAAAAILAASSLER